MIRTQVYFTREDFQLIEALASQEGMKKAEMLRRLMRLGANQLRRQRRKQKRTLSVGEALLKIARQAVSGPKNLSKNIDDYLYGNKSEYVSKKTSYRR